MTRIKIDYGIDLGTTNSAISRMDKGTPVIIKNDMYQKDITPSCISFNKKKTMRAGEKAFNAYDDESARILKEFAKTKDHEVARNSFKEFKRTMGTEAKYHSPFMQKEYTSEELSAELLKTLKGYVKDEDVNSVVITVPAKFRQSQIDATQRAAEMAGFGYCELLQEPIAASMAYGIDEKNVNGYWLVFDFGGGTFDVALMKVEEGIMKVVDTEGDNRLGGKDLDHAMMGSIIIPWVKENYSINKMFSDSKSKRVLFDGLKKYAEPAKIELSFKDKTEVYDDEPICVDDDGKEIELDLTISLEQFNDAVEPVFKRAVDICKKLLEKNKLKGSDLETILLVGGPTQCRSLREMLKKEISSNINTSINPMTAVTNGAALFASTKDIPAGLQTRDVSKIQLSIKYPETTVETEEIVGVKIDRNACSGDVPADIYVEIVRSDKGWSSGKSKIEDDAGIINILLKEGEVNNYEIALSDEQGKSLECEPTNFTIINGFKAADATLPRGCGLDIVDISSGEPKDVLAELKGLGKNQTLPAKGKGTFKVQQDIRPGNKDDVINIPIYEGKPGTKPITNEFINKVTITGDDLPQFLPAGSEVEITIQMDSSRRIKFEAFFPSIDESIELELEQNIQKAPESDELVCEIDKERNRIHIMEEDGVIDEDQAQEMIKELDDVSDLAENGGESFDVRSQVKDRLNEKIQEHDKLDDLGRWPQAEERVKDAVARAKMTNERFGDDESTRMLKHIEDQLESILQEKNLAAAIHLEQELNAFVFSVQGKHVGFWISMIKSMDDDFDISDWKDKAAARKLLDEAKRIIASNPSKESVSSIASQLFQLMANPSQSPLSSIDKSKLTR